MDELKRVFLSLEIPEETKEKINQLVGLAGEIYPHPMDNFHITLKFVGEVDDAKLVWLETLVDFLAQKFSPAPIQFEELKVVEGRLRLVALKTPELEGMYNAAMFNLEKIGIEREEKEYEPHVTLGKVRPTARPPILLYDLGKLNYIAGTMVLYQTTKGEKAAVYVPLKKTILGGNK